MDVEMEDSDQQISSRPTVDTRLSKKARTSQTAPSELALRTIPVAITKSGEIGLPLTKIDVTSSHNNNTTSVGESVQVPALHPEPQSTTYPTQPT